MTKIFYSSLWTEMLVSKVIIELFTLIPITHVMDFWLILLFGMLVGLGGLGVTCLPRDPWFMGSNPAEVNGFFQDIKILSSNPPGGTLCWVSRV